MSRARTVNGATGVFFGPREHPNIFREQGSIGKYFKKTGIDLILVDRNAEIWKTLLG